MTRFEYSNVSSNANNRDLFSAFAIEEVLTKVLPTFHHKFFTELKEDQNFSKESICFLK